MEVVALITARGGSKTLPRKNVTLLHGKPLIAWTIEAALDSAKVSRVIVSTDCPEIAAVSRWHGAETPFVRPAHLSTDTAPHIEVVLDAVRWLETHENYRPDFSLLLQPTSPMRTADDIDGAITLAEEKQADGVVSVAEARNHPYLTQKIADDGSLQNFVQHNLAYMRRQDLPPAVVFNGAMYLTRRTALLEQKCFLPRGVLPYLMPAERSWDVDDAQDLLLVEFLMRKLFPQMLNKTGSSDSGLAA